MLRGQSCAESSSDYPFTNPTPPTTLRGAKFLLFLEMEREPY
jgi:hypothetical protein